MPAGTRPPKADGVVSRGTINLLFAPAEWQAGVAWQESGIASALCLSADGPLGGCCGADPFCAIDARSISLVRIDREAELPERFTLSRLTAIIRSVILYCLFPVICFHSFTFWFSPATRTRDANVGKANRSWIGMNIVILLFALPRRKSSVLLSFSLSLPTCRSTLPLFSE